MLRGRINSVVHEAMRFAVADTVAITFMARFVVLWLWVDPTRSTFLWPIESGPDARPHRQAWPTARVPWDLYHLGEGGRVGDVGSPVENLGVSGAISAKM